MSILKGTKTFYDFGVSDQVAYNLKNRYMYGLVEMGAFTAVSYNSSNGTLKRSSPKVFEGLGAGWVWESGVSIIGGTSSPYPVSGIYFNNTFYNNGTTIVNGSFSGTFYVDYRVGKVVFSTDTPSATTVKCNYCFRDVAVYLADEPEWKTIENDYLSQFSLINDTAPSGLASILKKNRIWTPALIIDLQHIETDPLQLGGGETANCSIFYHIISDNAFSARRLCDLVIEQDQTSFPLYNINTAPFPLKQNGSLNSGLLQYPALSAGNSQYFWTSVYLDETNGGLVGSDADIYNGELRQIARVARYNSTY